MYNDEQIATICKIIKQYCVEHPEQFVEAMKAYSFQTRSAQDVGSTNQSN